MSDVSVLCPARWYYINQQVYTKPLAPGETVPVYAPTHMVTPDNKHKYHCFAVTELKTSDFSELKEADRWWLEHLGIQEVPVLAKVVCINENHIPLKYANAHITKVYDAEDNLNISAVGTLKNPTNAISYEQFFKDQAIFIKNLDRLRLYFLGYYRSQASQGQYLVRFYTPKTTTDKHYYHLQIIRSLQARLPEAVYKKLKETLNLRIQGEQLVFNIYYSERVREVKADFTVPTISKCVQNFEELAKDPVNFLVACYTEILKEGV